MRLDLSANAEIVDEIVDSFSLIVLVYNRDIITYFLTISVKDSP